MTIECTRARLLRKCHETEQAVNGKDGRGAALLTAVADAYRSAADILVADPTMENCPAGRQRDIDLAEEVCRQVVGLVRSAESGRCPDRWPIEDRWQEAEAMAGRLPAILAEARSHARSDHATPEGSRAISRMWLIASAEEIRRVGEALSEALNKARNMPYPDPEIAELEALAAEIIEHAQRLNFNRCWTS